MTTVLDLGGQVDEALRDYVERNPESRRLHEERAQFMPGGNTRSVIHVDPFPLTVVRGDGARIVDADGHEYLDFLGEYTAGLYGHSHPAIVAAIRDALADGIVLGAPNRYEALLAETVCARFPSIELVRFCNSGTEANLLALSLAGAVTEQEIARVNRLGDRLRDRLNAIDADFCATGYGSLVGLHFTRGPVRNAGDVPEARELRSLLHLHMLEQGYSYGRRGFIALSLPLGDEEIDGFATAVE